MANFAKGQARRPVAPRWMTRAVAPGVRTPLASTGFGRGGGPVGRAPARRAGRRGWRATTTARDRDRDGRAPAAAPSGSVRRARTHATRPMPPNGRSLSSLATVATAVSNAMLNVCSQSGLAVAISSIRRDRSVTTSTTATSSPDAAAPAKITAPTIRARRVDVTPRIVGGIASADQGQWSFAASSSTASGRTALGGRPGSGTPWSYALRSRHRVDRPSVGTHHRLLA